MSKDNSYLVEQRKRLTKVLDYLKSQGISQKEISNKCDIDYTCILRPSAATVLFFSGHLTE